MTVFSIPVMRCGSFCANNDMGEGSIIKQCWDSWPVIYATACSSNFEIDTVNRPGLVNLWYRKDLLGRWHSWLSQLFLCLLPDRCLYTVKYVCTYTHMWLHIVVHELPLLPNNTVSETFFAQIVNGVKCQPDIYHWGASLVETGWIMTLDKTFDNLPFKQEAVAAPVSSKFSLLSHFFRRPLLEV